MMHGKGVDYQPVFMWYVGIISLEGFHRDNKTNIIYDTLTFCM